MTRKIKGHVLSTNVTSICRREDIDRYLNLFGQYFNSASNCIMDLDLNGMTDAVISYSRVKKLSLCGECTAACMELPDKWGFGPADSIWEHIHTNQEKPDFMRVEVSDYTRRLCDNSLVISIKNSEYNRVVGEFCPHKKILITSDWTHDGNRVEFVTEFLQHMEDVKLLSKRTGIKKKPAVTLGADPEFEYIDPDTNEVLSCREMGIQDRVLIPSSSVGRIGMDGSGQQRELRPEPANTPEGLIENFEKLIRAGLDEIWSLRGEKFSCGGHIHLGGVEESHEFGTLLDYYLAPLNVLNSKARRDSGYGKPGASDSVRKQTHGMEYRVPPVGWLASKELARITLKIVQLAAEKHFYGEDIEITDVLSNDLRLLGLTEEEITTFFREIKTYEINGLPRDLKEAWGYKVPLKFVLEFRDGWSEQVKSYIGTLVRKMAVEEELGGRCVFYGLSADRGNVFSVVMAHMNGIDMPEQYGFMPLLKTGAGKNHVGMPASIRNNLCEAKMMKDTILEIVKRTIDPPTLKKKIARKTAVHSVSVEGSIIE
jgi:hypothetical protein